ncbi:MAG: hypothetical protein LUD22_03825 [Coprobacillus sp.]|nr:hypothetical protein [Coprobacillus sp.]
MKAKKALTLLPALLLVLGLGACGGSESESTVSREDAAYILSITITYEDEAQAVPEYASIYYSGTTNSWGFTELVQNGDAYELYFEEAPEAGEYEFGLVLEAKGTDLEEVGWSHKVNTGSGNETFTVLGDEEAGYVNSVTVETAQPLTDLFPDPSLEPATNVTFRAIISTITAEANDVYLIGGFNNDGWTTWNKCEYNSSANAWDFTFETLELGTVAYQFVSTTTGVDPEWGSSTSTGTVTQYGTGDLSHIVTQEDSNTVIPVTLA